MTLSVGLRAYRPHFFAYKVFAQHEFIYVNFVSY